MSYASEFLIENGILKEYYGEGGIIEIPHGVTEIAPYALCYCSIERLILPKSFVRLKNGSVKKVRSLDIIEITGKNIRFGREVFEDGNINPCIVAPKMSLGDVPPEMKKYFCCGFAKEETLFDRALSDTYIKYIRNRRKDLYEYAVLKEELLRLMLREKMVTRDESTFLAGMISESGKTELASEVLRYRGLNFAPEDPLKKLLRETGSDPYSVREIRKTWGFEKTEEKEVRITVYKGNEESVAVPPRVGKSTVTEIGTGCFCFQMRPRPDKGTREAEVREVYIPDSVTVIGRKAFDGCTELERVHFPGELEIIMPVSFEDCRKLSDVCFGENLKSIGSRAFLRCDGLTSVIIPEKVEMVESYAFSACRNLISVTFKGKTKSIQTEAFSDCINLEKVYISDGTEFIGYGAFGDCENLKEITIPESVTEIGRNAFYGCRMLTVYGKTGSFAEKYAEDHRIKFSEIIPLGDEET